MSTQTNPKLTTMVDMMLDMTCTALKIMMKIDNVTSIQADVAPIQANVIPTPASGSRPSHTRNPTENETIYHRGDISFQKRPSSSVSKDSRA